MSTLGCLGLARRIVDDMEILVIMFRVYIKCNPAPSNRRVFKALVSSLSESRESHSEKKRKKSRLAAFSSRLLVAQGDEAEEALFSARPESENNSSPTTTYFSQHSESDELMEWSFARNILEELALFFTWQKATARCCGCQPVVIRESRRRVFLGGSTWLLARFAITGITQLGLPLPAAFCLPYLIAHPLEILTARLAFHTTSTTNNQLAIRFWHSWRGALLAGILDTHIALGAAPRLRGLLHKTILPRHALTHFITAFPLLPEAICSVLAARFLAYLLFGTDIRHGRIRKRLQSCFDTYSSTRPQNYLPAQHQHHHLPPLVGERQPFNNTSASQATSGQRPLAASGHHHFNFMTPSDGASSTIYYYSGEDGRLHHHTGRDSFEDG